MCQQLTLLSLGPLNALRRAAIWALRVAPDLGRFKGHRQTVKYQHTGNQELALPEQVLDGLSRVSVYFMQLTPVFEETSPVNLLISPIRDVFCFPRYGHYLR